MQRGYFNEEREKEQQCNKNGRRSTEEEQMEESETRRFNILCHV